MITEILGRFGLSGKPKRNVERDLIRAESKIGATLFGPVPAGHTRDFFCLDSKTWIWREKWVDEAGEHQSMTTRYEVRPNGVMKIQDGQAYTYISGQELSNLANACKLYYENVAQKMYRNYVPA